MAYDDKGLQIESGFGTTGSGPDSTKVFREARYITNDTAATVEGAGYFNGGAKRLLKNTIINAIMVANGTPVRKSYIVTANTGTVVTVVLQKHDAG